MENRMNSLDGSSLNPLLPTGSERANSVLEWALHGEGRVVESGADKLRMSVHA
jgi:hypothetical protein